MKTIFLFLFSCLFVSTVYALPQCQGDDETKWQNCEGILTSASGREYVGVFNDGIFDGENENKVSYVGEFKNGTQHGQGTYTFPDGSKYEGEFRDGEYHGQGTATVADGSKYEGEWRDGKMHGQGTFTYANGNKYEGEYRDGKRHGQGTFTYANGNKYEGEWRDGNEHGQGTSTGANGDKYEGEWRDGKMHGQGTLTVANGPKYEGEWRDGNEHGQGTFTYANGNKYEGEWRDGSKHGQGTYTTANGDKYEGEYRDGKFIEAISAEEQRQARAEERRKVEQTQARADETEGYSAAWGVDFDDFIYRDGLAYEKFTDEPYSGKVTGTLSGTMNRGQFVGKVVVYHPNGQVHVRINDWNSSTAGCEIFDTNGDFIGRVANRTEVSGFMENHKKAAEETAKKIAEQKQCSEMKEFWATGHVAREANSKRVDWHETFYCGQDHPYDSKRQIEGELYSGYPEAYWDCVNVTREENIALDAYEEKLKSSFGRNHYASDDEKAWWWKNTQPTCTERDYWPQ